MRVVIIFICEGFHKCKWVSLSHEHMNRWTDEQMNIWTHEHMWKNSQMKKCKPVKKFTKITKFFTNENDKIISYICEKFHNVSAYINIWATIHVSVYMNIWTSIHVSVCMSICSRIHVSVYMSSCLYEQLVI